MPFPGSQDTLSLVVAPFDNTTLATVTVTGPGGAVLTPSTFSTDHATWLANPTYTVAGTWVARWVVTGVGAGVTEESIQVSVPASPAAAVTWRPELWHVAAYIPRRTLVGAVDGYGNALETFTNDTHPSAQAVNRLISDSCAWIGVVVNPVADTLGEQARAAAAIRTAGLVELTWPDNRDDISTADALLQQAAALRVDLDTANTAATGSDPEDPAANLLPVYSFPTPVAWGDALL